MAQIINTNIASLNSQRALNTSQSSLATALQRLSSGLRINSAKDDAAGLGISARMTTQIRGLNQASRNSNDGISLAQTGEGALAEMASNLQRIRELAVQSANATNSSADRGALDLEVQQRLAEIDRVAAQTNFNGRKLLDGSFGNATFQVGANVGESISVGLGTSMRSDSLGQIAQATSSAEVTVAALTGGGTIAIGIDDPVTIGASVAGNANGQSVGSAYAKAKAINSAGISGLTATATNNVNLNIANITSTLETGTVSLRINGVDIYSGTVVSSTITTQQVADKINSESNNTGVTAVLEGGAIHLSTTDGRDIAIAQAVTGDTAGGLAAGAQSTENGVIFYAGQIDTTVANATNNSAVAAAVNGGRLTLTANETIAITADGAIMGFAAAGHTISKDSTTISTVNVKDVASAEDTMYRIDSALTAVTSLRSTFGSIQNRFESVIANLSASAENITAARSRIQDADFAMETASLTRAQILQQAGIAMLAQANALPNNVLTLLR